MTPEEPMGFVLLDAGLALRLADGMAAQKRLKLGAAPRL